MRNNYPGQSTLQYKARPMGYAEMLQQREKARGEEGKLCCVYLLLIVGDIRWADSTRMLSIDREREMQMYLNCCKRFGIYHIILLSFDHSHYCICSYLMHNIKLPLYYISTPP